MCNVKSVYTVVTVHLIRAGKISIVPCHWGHHEKSGGTVKKISGASRVGICAPHFRNAFDATDSDSQMKVVER